MPQMMFVDSKVLIDSVEAKNLRIQYLQGLIEQSEQKAEMNERSRTVYAAIIRQYLGEIYALEGEIQRMENQIAGGRA